MWPNLRRDFERVYEQTSYRGAVRRTLHALTSPGFQAVWAYRFSRWLLHHHIPVVGAIVQRVIEVLTGVSIPPETRIGPGLLILHFGGIVIHGGTSIGEECTLHHGVTIGNRQPGGGAPQVGDRVMFGVGAKVLGEITIGHDADIGANAVVLEAVEERGVAVGNPAHVSRIKTEEECVRSLGRGQTTQGVRPKGELVIRVNARTIGIAAGILVLLLGLKMVLGGSVSQLTGRILRHVPHPDVSRMIPAAEGLAGPILVLGDFETSGEIGRWKASGVVVSQEQDHAVHGRHSVKLTYKGGTESPNFKLERWFDKERRAQNWSGYEYLVFNLYNPGESQRRLILQMKDKHGSRYKENIHVGAHQTLEWKVPLSDLGDALDIERIVQFNLFQWKPRGASTFYLDYVRLIRSESASDGGKSSTQQTALQRALDGPGAPDASHLTLADAGVSPNRLGGLRFERQAARWRVPDPVSRQPVTRVPMTLVGPDLRLPEEFSLSGGIPFAMGQLSPEAAVRLQDIGGAIWPIQTRPLATWEDGSVKWLLVTTQPPAYGKGRQLWLEYGPSVRPDSSPEPAVTVTETPEEITVTTGPLRFVVSKRQFRVFESVHVDRNRDGVFGETERLAGAGDMVIKHRGTEFRSSNDTQSYRLEVEETGPLRVTLKASGWFRDARGKGFCKFLIRLQAFAGAPEVRVYHTFIYTGSPANFSHHEYTDVTLPENETIQEISMELPITVTSDGSVVSADDRAVLLTVLDAVTTVSQRDHNAYRILKGRSPMHQGVRHEGWLLTQNASGAVLAAVRNAWQQFPKAFVVDPTAGRLVIKLWPESAGELNFETGPEAYGPGAVARGSAFGLSKTHELVFGFFGGPFEREAARTLVLPWLEPWLLAAHPAWLQATDVLGTIGPPTEFQELLEAEKMLDELFGWAERQPKDFAWYGMLDYGDVRSWYRKDGYDKSYDHWGWHPEGRWGWLNAEMVGNHAAALMSFVRTHNLKYFRFGEAAARHIMDVDTVHYNTVAHDPRLKTIISDAFSKVGSMHRHNAYHWGGRNEEATHTNVTGLLLYYYLTGYDRAWDVAQEVGEFLLRDPVTYRKHPDIAPLRAIGNVLWGDVLMYEATGDPRYRAAADKWATVLVEDQELDGTWPETYNPRSKTWTGKVKNNYIGFHVLPALIAYHRLSGNLAVGRAIVKATDVIIAREKYLQAFDGLAYSYLLTGQRDYLDEGVRRVRHLVRSQDRSDDPIKRGMVFGKTIFQRVAPILYSVPYFLGAMNVEAFPVQEKALTPAVSAGRRETQAAPQQALPYDVLVVPSAQKVLPANGLPPGAHVNPASISLARNEYEAAQLVIMSKTIPLVQVMVDVEELRQVHGSGTIPAEAISWSPVGFVKTNKPDYQVSHVGWWPDPLPAEGPFDVKKDWPQPVWVTVYAPPGTPAGEYTGTVTIRPANAPAASVQLIVTVWDFELPTTPTLKTAFDVYPNRIKSAYSKFFPKWWRAWQSRVGGAEQLTQRYYDDLVQHRLAPIFNLDIVDQREANYVRQMRERGLSAFAIGRYGGSFENNWPNDPSELARLQPLYRNYAHQLREAELLEGHYIYTYDEPSEGFPKVAEVARMIHAADPDLKNMVVLGSSPNVEKITAWFKDIDIVCLRNVTFDPVEAEKLQRMGKELWLYVSGPSPPYPTLVIDYPAMAYRVLPWMAWKYGIKGLLYWSVNYWTTNPYQHPMNTPWGQNGNGSLYYPGPEGPVSSVRLEVLRDGMEDYEYLHYLAELVEQVKIEAPQVTELIQQAEALLAVDPRLVESMRIYSKDPSVLEANRRAIAGMIEQLKQTLAGSRVGELAG